MAFSIAAFVIDRDNFRTAMSTSKEGGNVLGTKKKPQPEVFMSCSSFLYTSGVRTLMLQRLTTERHFSKA